MLSQSQTVEWVAERVYQAYISDGIIGFDHCFKTVDFNLLGAIYETSPVTIEYEVLRYITQEHGYIL